MTAPLRRNWGRFTKKYELYVELLVLRHPAGVRHRSGLACM
jgi:hypothetical protein